jgi:hypothetical protein
MAADGHLDFYNDHNVSSLELMAIAPCLYGCNEMYCDETTNATNIPFSTNRPLDNRTICQAASKNSATLAAGGHLEFWMTNI